MRKVLTVAAVAISAATFISGCSQSNNQSNDTRGTTSYAGMQKEFSESTKKLQWPAGYKVPEQVEGEQTDVRYQVGYGDTRASMLYECAWEKEWLATYSSKKEQAQTALKALEKVPSMGYMSPQRADDVTRQFFKDYLDRARLGDPSGFQQNVQANCPD